LAETPASLPLRLLRLARLALHLAHGVVTASLILPGLERDMHEQRVLQWSQRLLAILGIRVAVFGAPPAPDVRGCLFVANHVSWIDIWALKQLHPMHFIAKAEIRDWPVIGWLARRVGTLFIDRTRRHDTARMVRIAERSLLRGECLCFFPEGTTSDGNRLLAFKPGLMQAAINAGATVIPLAIRYPGSDGGVNTAVAYHGDITLLQSFLAVLRRRETLVELHFGAPVITSGIERRQLADQARRAIASLLGLAEHTAPDRAGGLPGAAR
jgi:1-acyl-sn-glycerol-3-phosphate acyltransferase